MPIYILSLYFLYILQIIVNFLRLKYLICIHKIIPTIQYTLNLKRKDHTPLKTSYNKS